MPLLTAPPDATRRHALLIGTTKYRDGWTDIGQGVRAELTRARELFVELGYETVIELVDPESATLRKEIARWRKHAATGPDDWLLVYYTGHGVEHAGMLRLITSDIEVEYAETALTAQEVVTALAGSHYPSHTLLIVDTCQSGAAQLDATSTAARLREAEGGAARGADFHIITSARSVNDALVGHFIEALSSALWSGSAASSDDEVVQLARAIEELNELLRKCGDQRASYAGAGERGVLFLPNPLWVPRLQKNMDERTRLHVLHRIQSLALRSHWNPRARGVTTETDPGWFFTGRSRALERIVQWLNSDAGAPGLVVKGLPGSGKSAVLARVVTLADREQRALAENAGVLAGVAPIELPTVGSLEVALHAHAKEPAQLALELGAALQIPLSSAAEDVEAAVVRALAAREGRIAIAVDALDEARRPEDCAAFLRRLLQKVPRLRLLIGARSSGSKSDALMDALGSRVEGLDLDTPAWYDANDVARYVSNYLLSGDTSAFRAVPADIVTGIADAVSERAGTSFLVASLTAHALRARADIPDPQGLRERLPANVGEALALDLTRFSGIAGEQIRAVLSALAVTFGRGLPQKEWLAIAQLVCGDEISQSDLERWQRAASFYIVDDEEFGVPVHRLYHDELARHLHGQIAIRDRQGIPSTLAALVPGDSATGEPIWHAASSYMLMYYPAHLVALSRHDNLLRLTTSLEWVEAKQRRFVNLDTVLSDLDVAVHVAVRQDPPAREAALRACAIYTRFATVAPPLVIDVLAGLEQRGRAEIMAENIEFPLDRSHAFALLAARYAYAGNAAKASACLRRADRAAQAVQGHFASMALYWVSRAAREIGHLDFAASAVASIHAVLDAGFLEKPDPALLESKDTAQLGLYLWAAERWEENRTFGIPHWLFWAAMCLRESADTAGLTKIREPLTANEPPATNLVLQTAAVCGDVDYLRSVTAAGITKPRNLALALIEAGLIAEFDKLRREGMFDVYDYADSAKRYAWALARRGDADAALEVADGIRDDPEERARAYYRIAQVAAACSNHNLADEVASHAARLLGELKATLESDAAAFAAARASTEGQPAGATLRMAKKSPRPVPAPRWRIESWLAPVMLQAGRVGDAATLVESVCDTAIAPSRENSLAMATPHTARAKGHVWFDSPVHIDQGFIDRLIDSATANGTANARKALDESEVTQTTRALSLAALSEIEQNPSAARDLWFEALVESRWAGRKTLLDVIARSSALHRVDAATPDDLRRLVVAVDAEFWRSAGRG